MTQNTDLTKEDVVKAVEDFEANFRDVIEAEDKSELAQIETLEGSIADRSYDLIDALLKLAIQLHVYQGVELAGYKSFLIERGLSSPRAGTNPYLPFVKAVFSKMKNGKWVFEDRSKEKYANALRHLMAQKADGGIKGTVQDYIRGYNVKAYGSKLKGIEAQDRADNPSQSAAKRVERLREAGEKARALKVITNDFEVEARKVVVLYGRTNANGEVEILKVKACNDDEADNFYYKLGRELTPTKAA